jgi:hypothetical protein
LPLKILSHVPSSETHDHSSRTYHHTKLSHRPSNDDNDNKSILQEIEDMIERMINRKVGRGHLPHLHQQTYQNSAENKQPVSGKDGIVGASKSAISFQSA